VEDIISKGIPFSNSIKLHDEIGNIKKEKASLAKAAFKNAENFYICSAILFKESIQFINVASVNLAFACELYLKAMLYKLDINFGRIHGLYELYQLLPVECQDRIKENIEFKYDKNENVELVLKEISDAFVFLRYSHERKAIISNWGGLSAIATAIMKVARIIMDEK